MELFENLQLLHEAKEKQKYSYKGPIYSFGTYIDTLKDPIFTMAVSKEKAISQLCWRLKSQYRGVITIDNSKLELVEEPKDIDVSDYEELTHEPVLNDPKYNYDDPGREDEYEVK